jgi:putative PIN family toxin of toxin-antitoxin system
VRIVLDANVVVSGLLNPHGPPGIILGLVADGQVRVCYDARILDEYREVLARTAFGFDPGAVEEFLEGLIRSGEESPSRLAPHPLPDPDDEPFLQVALGAGADCLVTGNLRHFPATRCRGVAVINPAGFVEVLRGKDRA